MQRLSESQGQGFWRGPCRGEDTIGAVLSPAYERTRSWRRAVPPTPRPPTGFVPFILAAAASCRPLASAARHSSGSVEHSPWAIVRSRPTPRQHKMLAWPASPDPDKYRLYCCTPRALYGSCQCALMWIAAGDWPAATKVGAVAQLGERCVRNAEVEGSTPFRSTLRIASVIDASRRTTCCTRPSTCSKTRLCFHLQALEGSSNYGVPPVR